MGLRSKESYQFIGKERTGGVAGNEKILVMTVDKRN
jgi:hypothetical protein